MKGSHVHRLAGSKVRNLEPANLRTWKLANGCLTWNGGLRFHPGAGCAFAGFKMAAPAGCGFGFLAEGEEGAGFEEGFGAVERWREVARAEGFERGGGFAGIEEYLGEGRRRRSVAGIVLQYGFAQCAGARGLAVPQEHPCGEEEKLAVVFFQG